MCCELWIIGKACMTAFPFNIFGRCETAMKVQRVPPYGWALCMVLGLAMLSVWTGCDSPAPASTEQPTPKVTVTEVVAQETIDADEYMGQTEASEVVEVRARVFGYLKKIEFEDGDYVEEGKTLFTIEPDEYDAIHQQSLSRIDLNAANLELAKAKHARNEKLLASNAVSREEYEESLASVKSAEATITAAKADANRTALDL
jgi:multidrug efflux system membrane fusion protein